MAQTQFRSDDSEAWAEKYGTGADGNKTISADTTDNAPNSTLTGTVGGTSATIGSFTGFADGDLVLIHQSRGTGAGQWELNKIASHSGTALTMRSNLKNTYASGAQIIKLLQYDVVTVDSTKNWAPPGWDGSKGGIIPVLAKTSITVNGTIHAKGNDSITSNSINAAGGGFRGGGGATNTQATQGEGESGVGGGSQAANGLGGGGGKQGSGNGSGGSANHTVANLVTKFLFGGGGGGHNANTGQPAARNGANGGGIILLISPAITITGALSVRGGKGLVSTSGQGPAGSGGGGCILIKGDNVVLGSSLVLATGQNADTQTLFGDPGGAGGGSTAGGVGSANLGGSGRIHVDYGSSLSGTTSPTLDSTQDSTLVGSLLKSISGLARSSVKSLNGLVIASTKKKNGLA